MNIEIFLIFRYVILFFCFVLFPRMKYIPIPNSLCEDVSIVQYHMETAFSQNASSMFALLQIWKRDINNGVGQLSKMKRGGQDEVEDKVLSSLREEMFIVQ